MTQIQRAENRLAKARKLLTISSDHLYFLYGKKERNCAWIGEHIKRHNNISLAFSEAESKVRILKSSLLCSFHGIPFIEE
jgi:hypothetical protein